MTRCLVTGAAAGIGRALAERFGRAGHRVVGVDHDRERAEMTRKGWHRSGIDARFLQADLSDPSEVASLVEELEQEGPLELVVHNAGTNCVGRFADSDWDAQRRVLELNLVTPLVLTARLLERDLVESGGALVFVSSLSRFVGYPGAAGYAATKDGLASYARSLRVALAPRGVHVMTVYPGPTRTEHARRFSPPGSSEDKRMAPEELAERVFRALQARRRTLVPGLANRVFAALGHALPRATERAMKRAILDRLDD